MFRVFVSSPGDVEHERLLVERVLLRLRAEFAAGLPIEPIFWEQEPLSAVEHPQDQLTLPSQCDAVICILWSRLGTRLPPHFRRPDGSAYESGTAFEFEDAARGFAARGKPDLLVYRKMEIPVVSLAEEVEVLQRLSQRKNLDAFIDSWFKHEETRLPTATLHRFATADEFEKLVEMHLRRLLERAIPAREQQARIGSIAKSWTNGCPFRGLEVFEFEHSQIFFGRTQAIADIVSNLRRRSLTRGEALFVTVLGMSGCGKSSLIRAGVLPLLVRPGVVDGTTAWAHCIFRPSDSPRSLIDGLATCLLNTIPLRNNMLRLGMDAEDFDRTLRERPEAACEIVARILASPSSREPVPNTGISRSSWRIALVIDQMEEMFTLDTISADERRVFARILSLLSKSGVIWVLATLRSDFYHRCEEVPDLQLLMKGLGQYHLGPPTPADIGVAVRMPAAAAGLHYERHPVTGEPLDDRLRDAAVNNPGSLPLLEFTLTELYARCASLGVLTNAAYDEIGGVEGAVCAHAEKIVAALSDKARQKLPAVFHALVSTGPGDRETVSRTYARTEDICRDTEMRAVVEKLIDGRLLATQRDTTGASIVYVTHEVLLDKWPRLARWISDNRLFIQTRARVTENAARWQAERKPDDLLIPEGRLLDEAEDMVKANAEYLKKELIEYISASREKTESVRATRRTERLASVGTLAAGMAHEIKNPLQVLKTFCQLLPERYNDEEFRATGMPLMSQEISRIDSMVNSLLRFARPRQPIFKPVSVHAILEQTLGLFRGHLEKKKVRLSTDWRAPDDFVLGDSDLLQQAFLNLMLNGVEAMENGGCLTITTANKGRFLTVAIRDQGVGIGPNHLPHIFDPFFTTKNTGTGLGLSVTHGIVYEHKGIIDVESVPGVGSVFYMHLPLAENNTTADGIT